MSLATNDRLYKINPTELLNTRQEEQLQIWGEGSDFQSHRILLKMSFQKKRKLKTYKETTTKQLGETVPTENQKSNLAENNANQLL